MAFGGCAGFARAAVWSDASKRLHGLESQMSDKKRLADYGIQSERVQ